MPLGKANKQPDLQRYVTGLDETLATYRRFGVGNIRVEKSKEEVQCPILGHIKTVEHTDLVNLPDHRESSRRFIGDRLFTIMRGAELAEPGIHVKLFEPLNFPFLAHYMGGGQNNAVGTYYKTRNALPPIMPEDARTGAPSRPASGIPKQHYTHTLPEYQNREHFAAVSGYGPKQARKPTGWVANSELVEAYTGGLPATYKRLLARADDDVPVDLPQDHFIRFIDKPSKDGSYTKISEKWEKPTQTLEQRARLVATYTNADTHEKQEFDVHGMSSEPDNLIATVNNGLIVAFIKAAATEVVPVTTYRDGLLNRILGRKVTTLPPIVPPAKTRETWMVATYREGDERSSNWEPCNNPYLYMTPKSNYKDRHVEFAGEAKTEISLTTALDELIPVSENLLEHIASVTPEVYFGLSDEILMSIVATDLDTTFYKYYPSVHLSLAEQTVLFEKFKTQYEEYLAFADNVINPEEPLTANPATVERFDNYLYKRATYKANDIIMSRNTHFERPDNLLQKLDAALAQAINASYPEYHGEIEHEPDQEVAALAREKYLQLFAQFETLISELEVQSHNLTIARAHIPIDNSIWKLSTKLITTLRLDLLRHQAAIKETFYTNPITLNAKPSNGVQTAYARPQERVSVLRPPVIAEPAVRKINHPKPKGVHYE